MNKEEVLRQIKEVGVVPVVRARSSDEAALGGASYLKALKAPLPQIELIPTGGVSLKTAADFIRAGASALGVGADLVDLKALAGGQAEVITERARQFVEIVREARQKG